MFIGKIGWEVDGLIKEIRKNKMFGKQLFGWTIAVTNFYLRFIRKPPVYLSHH